MSTRVSGSPWTKRTRICRLSRSSAAPGDRQDNGPGRSLAGLNRAVLQDAQEKGLITGPRYFPFHGRETRPIHEAIAMTYTPYIPGLSGAKDAVPLGPLELRLHPEGAREVAQPRRALRRGEAEAA